ncbi:stage V sporulation protein D (sporulation-specific penicillin-binding protein) [Eubacterium ruminantium]|uniref:Stage V sporulation protein D (Sporulation-specific penicillin-binding protein) n=1 Tax=Eubacterium ruminantium TaxID=42322 RepID=A0A1T4NVJ4_9FIRM|nr:MULTISPECIES: penicillin-binding protein 2 [Eubacterium]MCR5368003.1 penicillin-binding protein 2 [Eubacterium sp.]SCW55940.1 stage V sporulation protein D (sporulation-specific penicillin-binding protein) [Eubacterium ruminantium]SDN04246.1 stage V sporulation protein D (sporulation-specific penicillin-binding protein) [Eubacterium ruminantium]SJZ83205.1 stage V sporulation protein D (sporulation-specific penicillin-binding protein) [Eubacterium ruminantium]
MSDVNNKRNGSNSGNKIHTKRRKVFLRRMRIHLLVVMGIITLALIVVAVRLIQLNVKKGKEYETRVLSQRNYTSTAVPYKRGEILDRNGSVLAMSSKVYNLIIEPKNILRDDEKKEKTCKALTTYFDITREELDKYLEDKDSLYDVVRKGLSYDQVKKFTDYEKDEDDVVGVWFEESYVRVYPNKELGCHMLGFVVSGNVGLGGIEGEYNEYLNGEDGRTYVYLTDDYTTQKTTEPANDGDTVVTTIDAEIQNIVQSKVDEYMETVGAENVSVLVMDPNTCEILALCNGHQYDPNDAYDTSRLRYQFATQTDAEFKETVKKMSDDEMVDRLNRLWRSYVISDNFEPGSTFKVFTIAGALEDKVLDGSETFFCDGHQTVADWDINCVNHDGHGTLTVSGALEQSCNDCLMQIAAMEGPEVFDKYQQLFGFGQRTNVDLPGEQGESALSSLIYHKDTLNAVELATSAFGQGVTVSMIQLGTAFCSAINGGYYYKPHVVSRIQDKDGNLVKSFDRILVRRTISEETSAEMRGMLKRVVTDGTGWRAGIDGYSIGGKTGTAEKQPRGNDNYILSFIGFAPVEDPKVVVYCVVDEPHVDSQYLSGAGAVVFNMIATELFPYMNIYKSDDTYEGEASDDEQVTPVYNGEAPDNDVAGGGVNDYESMGATSNSEGDFYVPTPTDADR